MSDLAFMPHGAYPGSTGTPNAQTPVGLTGAAQTINLPFAAGGGAQNSMRIFVDGGSGLAWCYGSNPNLTYSNGLPMPANSVEVFRVPAGVTQITVIGQSASGTVRVSSGEGM